MNTDNKDLYKKLKKESPSIDQFNVITVDLMIELYKNNVLTETVINYIHKLNLWYYTILEKIQILEEKANIDNKTGLLKYNDDYLEKLLKIASRTMERLEKGIYYITYLRIDIDDFSVFNNQYGHSVGDVVLKEIADRIRRHTRPTDYCIRYGGEEFDLLLPNTDKKGAKGFADKFYKAISELNVEVDDKKVHITLSMGLTVLRIEYKDMHHMNSLRIKKWYKRLQEEVDDALYKAKYLGKNQYCFYEQYEKSKYRRYREDYAKRYQKSL